LGRSSLKKGLSLDPSPGERETLAEGFALEHLPLLRRGIEGEGLA
jgi:hypothetical protein